MLLVTCSSDYVRVRWVQSRCNGVDIEIEIGIQEIEIEDNVEKIETELEGIEIEESPNDIEIEIEEIEIEESQNYIEIGRETWDWGEGNSTSL